MKCERSGNLLTLQFEEREKELLLFSLGELEEHYSTDEPVLSAKLQGYWTGRLTRSREIEKELAGECADLSEARTVWKSERLILVRKWLAEQGTLKTGTGGILVLDQGGSEQFLSVLNDRRLLLALEHNLDEELMSRHLSEVKPLELQQALWEIHFLAIIQHYLLEGLGEGTG